MMDARRLIIQKRDGGELSAESIKWLSAGIADGTVTDSQAGALAMAVLLNGMTTDERVALTQGFKESGKVLEWDVDGPVVDKHSTGGLGDNVSLVLAPALAACGAYVPMISGRGLGHTGGTLDKMESIPGYQAIQESGPLRRIVEEHGAAIVGASSDLAPADRRLYAIRDIAGAVESVDLITASILSKKLAEGIEALALDVKCGSGAFMKTPETAHELAKSLADVANGAGCRAEAIITDMSEPLASAAGNSLEVINALDLMTGHEADNRLWDVTMELGAALLKMGGLAQTGEEGRGKLSEALGSGRAAERFAAMAAAMGGPPDLLERYREILPAVPVVEDIESPAEGHIASMDTEAIGYAVIDLGGGRRAEGDRIDHGVGFDQILGIGARVSPGDALMRVHAGDESQAAQAREAILKAVRISESPPEESPLVIGRVG